MWAAHGLRQKMLETIDDEKYERCEDTRQWLGEDFYPTAFDPKPHETDFAALLNAGLEIPPAKNSCSA